MILKVDNKGAVDLANNWMVGGRTRHTEVRVNFLRELKDDGIVKVRWILGDKNDADIHTKNLGGPAFEKHSKVYNGKASPESGRVSDVGLRDCQSHR